MPLNEELVRKLENEFSKGNPCGPFYDELEHGHLEEPLQRLWATATYQLAQVVYQSQYQKSCEDLDTLKEALGLRISEVYPDYEAWEPEIVDWD